MRIAFRMADREILHTISSSNDSTIVAEVVETRLMHKYKHFLSFEKFKGELRYSPGHPENSRLTLDVDARSIVCRNQWLRASKQRRMAEYIRDLALKADAHPTIQFSSYRMSAKALRGYIVEGVLTVRGTTHAFKMNVGFVSTGADRLQIEADAVFRLSEFGIKPPSSLFGMIETKDQVLVHLQMCATSTISVS